MKVAKYYRVKRLSDVMEPLMELMKLNPNKRNPEPSACDRNPYCAHETCYDWHLESPFLNFTNL